MKLLQLKYFEMTCRCGNVTKAAEMLYVSQPAVSQAIKDLEKEFEVDLFLRHNKQFTLTPEGEFFHSQVKEILSRSDLLYKQMLDFKCKNNIIHLGISPVVGSILLPPIYQEMKETYPEIELRITELSAQPLLDSIECDKIDMAIMPVADVELTKFSVLPLTNIELVFCTNKSNPLSQRATISFSDLQNEPLILTGTDSAENKLIMERFQREQIVPKIILCSDHLHTIDHFINHAVASSLLYKTIIHRGHSIVTVPFQEPLVTRIALVWKKNKYLHSGSQQFVSFLKSVTFKFVYDNCKPVKEKDNLIPSF